MRNELSTVKEELSTVKMESSMGMDQYLNTFQGNSKPITDKSCILNQDQKLKKFVPEKPEFDKDESKDLNTELDQKVDDMTSNRAIDFIAQHMDKINQREKQKLPEIEPNFKKSGKHGKNEKNISKRETIASPLYDSNISEMNRSGTPVFSPSISKIKIDKNTGPKLHKLVKLNNTNTIDSRSSTGYILEKKTRKVSLNENENNFVSPSESRTFPKIVNN